jgi:hypothetical protein
VETRSDGFKSGGIVAFQAHDIADVVAMVVHVGHRINL